MLFDSTIFLLAFLPAVILCYYTQKIFIGNRLRNGLLLFFSYLFYIHGAARFLALLVGATAIDFFLALLIERYRRHGRWWVSLSVIFNLGFLAYFKYAHFMIGQILGLPATGLSAWHGWSEAVLPIGISFFTFQKLSYIIDVHRGHARALSRPVDFALYVAMFSHLVAGPIVRFKDIADQLQKRMETWHLFYLGALRFCWGLAKKVLIADACGQVADAVFGLTPDLLDTKSAWLGALAYTFQIYFDFSAYADMAIGLARMFGFQLRENFNRPYAALSLTDFWRRWHISLSNWFRDYLYIPLGGNQKGPARTTLHLLLVFGLCGLWHGANWTFIAWGFYHGFFLAVERATALRYWSADRCNGIRRAMTFLIIIFGWVLFRAETLCGALDFMQTMVVPIDRPMPFELFTVLHLRNGLFLLIALFSVLGAAHLPTLEQMIQSDGPLPKTIGALFILVVLPYCAAFIIAGARHPFIYYKF